MHLSSTSGARLLPVLVLALITPLAGCSDEPTVTAGDEPTATASATHQEATEVTTSPSGSPSADPGPVTVKMNGWRVTVRLEATDRFRQDFGAATRIHLLPLDVVSDPTAERWGDIFVWSPTRVYDPGTQNRRPLPADLVAWLRDNPGIKVLREKRVALGDAGRHKAWQLDVDRDGSELFGDREGGLDGDGFERMVLWQVEDTWFVAQASTFLGKRGLLAPDEPDDVLRQVLASARFERA